MSPKKETKVQKFIRGILDGLRNTKIKSRTWIHKKGKEVGEALRTELIEQLRTELNGSMEKRLKRTFEQRIKPEVEKLKKQANETTAGVELQLTKLHEELQKISADLRKTVKKGEDTQAKVIFDQDGAVRSQLRV